MNQHLIAFAIIALIMLFSSPSFGLGNDEIDNLAQKLQPKIVAWRRHIHQNPELGNREFKTAEMVAKHLRKLGLEVKAKVAHTGVVGVLKGAQPGPVVALRADMDALPIVERTDVPFKSRVTTTFNGQKVGVMHACGHDAHTAILMGVAEILSGMKSELKGTVKFIFQPAEEGTPAGEEGGAEMMVKEGVLQSPDVDVIFGLHISSGIEVGRLNYRPGGYMASSDSFKIVVRGKQTHGARPWAGVDPIVASAHIVTSLQSIVSRHMPLTEGAAVLSVGAIHGGVRTNIIPEEVEMIGTIRALDADMRRDLHRLLRQTATKVAEAHGASAAVTVPDGHAYPITYNDEALVEAMLPSLKSIIGRDNVVHAKAITGAEDFSFFQEKVPGFYFFIGGRPRDVAREDAPPHHTPDFYIDESGFSTGVKAFVRMTLDYMNGVHDKMMAAAGS